MKKIIIISLILYVLLIINSFSTKVYPTISSDNIYNTLDNDPKFINILKEELNKKYPEYIVLDAINGNKIYNVEETDLYVELYSNLLASNLNIYIDCRNLQDYNLGCSIDNNYVNKNNARLDEHKKTVALTFDDGPSSNNKIITDLLSKYKANATFFVLGSKLDVNGLNDLKYTLKMGNEIGSHGYSHKILSRVKHNQLDDEFNRVDDIIKQNLNYDIKLVRPPYGIINDYIRNKYDYSYIIWDIDTLDWKVRSAKSVYNKVIGKVHDGDIILMHETYYSTYKALELILPELYQEGIQVTTISNLAKLKGINLQSKEIYYNFK